MVSMVVENINKIILTDDDIDWLRCNYKRLEYSSVKNSIEGTIEFDRICDNKRIKDEYDIKIILESGTDSIIPKVFAADNKIKNIAGNLKRPLSDLHVNYDNTFCLTIRDSEHEYFTGRFNLKEFFENLLEPYLYWISHYNKYGSPPWSEYAHGFAGYIELYGERKIDLKRLFEVSKAFKMENTLKNWKGHWDCMCGSKIKSKYCHPEILKIIFKIQKEL